MKLRMRFAAVICLGVLAVVGCGKSASTGGPTAEATSEVETSRALGVCLAL